MAFSPRRWPAVDIEPAPRAAADPEGLQGLVLAALDEYSITAVQELTAGWRIFFTSSADRDRAMDLLGAGWPDGLHLQAVDVADEDWARRSQENLGPVQVGRVRISPPWTALVPSRLPRSSPPSLAIDIIIQPSMGFGTGHHATTRLCTALLQQVDLAGSRVLDVGTGSGVLAIAASRLGAGMVLGIDDDADALEAARENLSLNAVESGIELRHADFRALSGPPFDLVTANLTGALLARGAASLLAALAPGATLILSGVTSEEEASVRAAFDPRVVLRARLEEAGWVGLRYERPA